jgi:protein TonB
LLVSIALHAGGIAIALGTTAAAAPRVAWVSVTAPPSVPLPVEARVAVATATPQPELPVHVEPAPAEPQLMPPPPAPLPPSFDELPELHESPPDPQVWMRTPEPRAWLAPVLPRPAPATPPTTAAAAVTGDVQPTALADHNQPPAYPYAAWRHGIEGTVVVLLQIDASGAVTAAHVERSSGSGMLDDAALRQLAKWRFAPARRSGRAVPGTFRQEVVFRLTR